MAARAGMTEVVTPLRTVGPSPTPITVGDIPTTAGAVPMPGTGVIRSTVGAIPTAGAWDLALAGEAITTAVGAIEEGGMAAGSVKTDTASTAATPAGASMVASLLVEASTTAVVASMVA